MDGDGGGVFFFFFLSFSRAAATKLCTQEKNLGDKIYKKKCRRQLVKREKGVKHEDNVKKYHYTVYFNLQPDACTLSALKTFHVDFLSIRLLFIVERSKNVYNVLTDCLSVFSNNRFFCKSCVVRSRENIILKTC